MTPVLSICMPTRNRAAYLEPNLAELTAPNRFAFPIEIVIGDNGSVDDTARIVAAQIAAGAPIRYIRHPRDLGFQANLFAIFRAAVGEFAIYLADDDRLAPSALAETIADLQRRPEIVALYGPLADYDPTTDTVKGQTFILPEPVEYGPRDRIALLRMLLERNIIPEVPIVRSRVLGASLFRSTHIYWAYTLLDRLLEAGAVRFTNMPYYRAITQHWPGETRSTVAARWGLSDWEACRRGLDYFLWRARSVSPPLAPDEEAALAGQLAAVNGYFLSNAMYGRYINNDHVAATEVGMLAVAAGHGLHPQVKEVSRLMAASDLLLEVLDASDGLARVALYGFQSPQAITTLLRTRRADLPVDVVEDPRSGDFRDAHLIVAVDRQRREDLLDAGFRQGRVIDFDRLLGFVTIPETVPPAGAG
jgi:hypothetical protein